MSTITQEEKSQKLIIGGKMNKNNKYYEYDWCQINYRNIKQFPLTGNSIWERYKPLIGVRVNITLGEGNTPLLTASEDLKKWSGFTNLWIKHEELNPTGCFKDRESAVVLSKVKRDRINKVSIVSSGNAALSTAAYAQIAKLKCDVYIPRKTSAAKKQLIKIYGAILYEIPGFYEDVYRYVVDHPTNSCNVTSGQNKWRVEGNKTITYEIWEQMGYAPDIVVVPAGNGGCLAGIWKGFEELRIIGKTKNTPRIVAVQIEGAAPLKEAIRQHKQWINLGKVNDSIAEGIVAAESYCSPKAIEAITKSNGRVVTVNDTEVLNALSILTSKESLITEPTSAAAFAGLKKLSYDPNSHIVIINTGSGMKMISEIPEFDL